MKRSYPLDPVPRWKCAATLFLLALVGLLLRVSAPAQTAPPLVPPNLARTAPPSQPIPYSHKTHLELGLGCKDCHANPAPGRLMTYPASNTCMQCHENVDQDKPAIRKLAALAKSGNPIPWVRVYQLTPGVQWSHGKHLQAGVQCETCHGQVAEMDVMAQATSVTAMGVCIRCHQASQAKTSCNTCHLWP
jgi:hypothetical protein